MRELLFPLDDAEETLFCSDWCKETAEGIRYFRRVSRDGRMADPDVGEAVGIRMAFIVSGGYSSLGRELSAVVRADV